MELSRKHPFPTGATTSSATSASRSTPRSASTRRPSRAWPSENANPLFSMLSLRLQHIKLTCHENNDNKVRKKPPENPGLRPVQVTGSICRLALVLRFSDDVSHSSEVVLFLTSPSPQPLQWPAVASLGAPRPSSSEPPAPSPDWTSPSARETSCSTSGW